ncbi:hypothetical protein L3Q82_021083 [Scortum barcoo]|uniref:Uncharacterized protein n=1 Tax=Scortum barcoo TaxID=214431 RepID=A0ACB8X8D9_9TELE|nr:hypothetical protein L3Q82_021083 [Scortum barcoo]
MIDFVVVSSDLRPYVLDTRVKRGAELSTDHHLVVSWIRWQRRKLDRPGRPKLRRLWTQGLWCLSWWQSPNPWWWTPEVRDDAVRTEEGVPIGPCWPVGLLTQLTGTGRPKQAAARTVLEAKTRVWEEFGEAMEEDYRSASKRFWQTVRRLRRGKQYSANTVYSAGGELLTSTGDIVGRWKKYFEDLLNPTDLPSNEEAEAGDSEVDSSITQAEVTEVVQQAPRWQGAGGLRQGTGEENSADSRPLGFRRNNAVFVLVVEHWTSSIPSTGCLRVYGSLPNQSTCALWIWRRHSTVSLVVFCGECSLEYGVRGPLLRAVRSLYDRSRSLVRALPAVRFLGVARGRRESRFGNHRISSLLFADDVVLLASSSQDLQHVLERFAAAECEAAGMRISTSKSEAMVLDRKRVACPLQVGGEVLPQVEEFKYLGVLFTSEGKMEREIDRADWCSVRSYAVGVPDRRGEEGAESKGEALDLPVNLRSHPHLWS